MLTSRAIQILHNIIEHKGIYDIKELSETYHISERMIRYDFLNINYYLKKQSLPELEIKNHTFSTIDLEKLEQFIEMFYIDYEFSTMERVILLLLALIFEPNINIRLFCQYYGISRIMGNSTLKKAHVFITKFSLSITEHKDHTLKIIGTEEEIRYFLLYVIHKYFKTLHKTRFTTIIQSYIFTEIEYDITIFILEIQNNLKKTLSDKAFYLVKNYLYIAITRSKAKQYVHNAGLVLNTIEYSIVKRTCESLDLKELLFENEMLKLTELIIGVQSHNTYDSFYDIWIHQHKILKQFIKDIGEKLGCPSIINDNTLYKGLVNHIKPSIYRLKNNLEFDSEIYYEAQELESDLFEVVSDTLKNIEHIFDVTFSFNETTLIVIHFKAAIERNTTTKTKLHILLACSFGFGTSVSLAQQISSYYEVDIVGIVPAYQLFNAINYYDSIDYIITNLDIDTDNISIPVLKLGAFLSYKDFQLLDEEKFPRIKVNRYKLSELLTIINSSTSPIEELKEYFGNALIDDINSPMSLEVALSPALIHFDQVDSWENAVRKGCSILEYNNYITEDYTNSVVQNIYTYSSYMVTSFLMLHQKVMS